MISPIIKPPANGKKLWRVRKPNTASRHESNTLQCLQNSLKITAAGSQFTAKKPQLKRPRNKPGMPKDFVFVDLSPVKDSDLESSEPPSPVMSENSDSNDSLMTNDTSISDLSLETFLNDGTFGDFNQENFNLDNEGLDFGLGLMDFDDNFLFPQESAQSVQESNLQITPTQPHVEKFETPQNQIIPNLSHNRSKSVDSIKKKPLQFKTYSPKPKGDKKVRKPELHHRHTISAPVDKLGLEDFMNLNNQIKVSLNEEIKEGLHQPFNSELVCGIDQFLSKKQEEFDFSAFVSI